MTSIPDKSRQLPSVGAFVGARAGSNEMAVLDGPATRLETR